MLVTYMTLNSHPESYRLFSYFSDSKIAFDLKTIGLLIRELLVQF